MKKLLGLVVLLVGLSLPSWATWANVQAAANSACPASTTCAVTVTNTGAGHLLVAVFGNGGTTQRTISSVSGGGTWTLCGASCQAIDATCGCAVDAAYALSSSSGATTITLTLSGTTSSAFVQIYEFSYAGTAVLNTGTTPKGTIDDTVNTTTPAGVALTLSANNSVIVQGGYAGATCNAVSGGWTGTFPGGDCAAYKLNTTAGTAPTWTQSASNRLVGVGIAFEESGAGGGTVVMRPVVY